MTTSNGHSSAVLCSPWIIVCRLCEQQKHRSQQQHLSSFGDCSHAVSNKWWLFSEASVTMFPIICSATESKYMRITHCVLKTQKPPPTGESSVLLFSHCFVHLCLHTAEHTGDKSAYHRRGYLCFRGVLQGGGGSVHNDKDDSRI